MRAMLLLVFSLVLSVSAAAQVAPPETIHVSYQNISLSYDASLGTALSLETVPAVDLVGSAAAVHADQAERLPAKP